MVAVKQSSSILNYPTNPADTIARFAMVSRGQGYVDGHHDSKLVEKLLSWDPPHLTPFESVSFSVLFRCSRAIANEFTRHRLASFIQSSTRYINMTDNDSGLELIEPYGLDDASYLTWTNTCMVAESAYKLLIAQGVPLEVARGVLPLDTAAYLVCHANFREWFHIFHLRLDKAAHPQFRELLTPVYDFCMTQDPAIWEKGVKLNDR